MSLWGTRTVQGRRSTFIVEGLGLVVCNAIVLVAVIGAGIVAWLVG